MNALSRFVAIAVAALPLSLAAQPARADNPCGKFEFTGDISCKIEVSGGCTADCTPLKLEAGCSGSCSGTAQQTCTGNCGAMCVAQCDPMALDCFAGCHTECDQPVIDECKKKHPDADCVNVATAQCDTHCKDACAVPQNNCEDHCNACCGGACTTQVNFDCDFDCYAKLQGGCQVQCDEPSGALFCNGQYIGASDVEACISYLATQGIKVDVSAKATATCDLSGCHGDGGISGCAAAPSGVGGFGGGLASMSLLGLVIGIASERRRRRQG
jgi:hypothetical protein